MAKRKREEPSVSAIQLKKSRSSDTQNPPASRTGHASSAPQDSITIQVITGSYERVLHGIQATIPSDSLDPDSSDETSVRFSDTFLFAAHSSAIRCLALSPLKTDDAKSQDVILASGATDERINLYSLSIKPTLRKKERGKPLPVDLNLAGRSSSENSRNRELGSLLHHASAISGLHFPSRSKLLTSADDNTIAFVRARDWTVLSTLKAPIPKPVGRPSGDTAAPGEVPAGISDFAVHPSNKLMVSVGRGERCMRLWNLVTGKKAGVLNFDREILQQVGEGKWSSGEGRKVEWNAAGEEFLVTFDRGAVVFDMECKAKALLIPRPPSKVHQIKYVPDALDFVALSTEDGRIAFFNTTLTDDVDTSGKQLPRAPLVAQLGGREYGLTGRVKDFEILRPQLEGTPALLVTGNSDGAVRIWSLQLEQDRLREQQNCESGSVPQVGRLLGTYESGNRITCLRAFVMIGVPGDADANGVEALDDEQVSLSSSGDD